MDEIITRLRRQIFEARRNRRPLTELTITHDEMDQLQLTARLWSFNLRGPVVFSQFEGVPLRIIESSRQGE